MRKDDLTAELPGVPKKRGRPASGQAKTPGQRQKEYLDRLAAEGKTSVTMILSVAVVEALQKYMVGKDITQGEAADKLLRQRLRVVDRPAEGE